MWQGSERRSRASRLARALVTMKEEADRLNAELGDVPRWRPGRRAELEDVRDDLRDQERELVRALGGRGG
jgi:predicted  nucleic acid-binding Zn-ribbon protein